MLSELQAGNKSVLEKLLPIVYDELRKLASQFIRKERADHTLQTTALVHEAYIRLVGQENIQAQNRAHFFGIAAGAMRQILIEYARNYKSAKRGGGEVKITLRPGVAFSEETTDEILALDSALKRLATFDERKARVVELRYFTGLTIEETAEVLQTSPATVKRDWNLARAWLFREISAN